MNDLDNIRKRFQAGELDPIRQQIIHFLCLHRDEFFCFLEREEKTWQKPIDRFTALRLFILDKRTLDFRADLACQSDEMNRNIRENACGCDPATQQKMKAEWIQQHAGRWRANRILEIIYVLNQHRDFFMKFLDDPASVDYSI